MSETLDLHNTIQLDDGPYQFLERTGQLLRFRHLVDGTILDITATQIANRRVGTATPLPVSGLTYDRLTRAQQAPVDIWRVHLTELTTGLHPAFKNPRPQYALDRPMGDRVASKVEELVAMKIKASQATIYRKLRRYAEDGPEGIVDGRVKRTYTLFAQVSEEVMASINYVLKQNTHQSTGTISRTIANVKAEIERSYGKDTPIPTDPSFYRYIRLQDKGMTKSTARQRETAALRQDTTYRQNIRATPGEEVQIDTNTLDLDVFIGTDEKGKPKYRRVLLSLMMDVTTRSIIGFTFRLTGTKGVDQTSLLIQSMTPRENRPDRDQVRQLVIEDYPEHSFLTAEERATHEAAMPFIKAKRIMTDNGADYRSNVFLSAAKQMGVDLTHANPHRPTQKPHVERVFRAINTGWTQHLPGYVGGSPDMRGDAIHSGHILTLDAVFELFDDWVISQYQNRPHKGLLDREDPTIELSPNQKYHATSDVNMNIYVPLTWEKYIAFLPSEYRRISRKGIELNGFVYDSPELHFLRETRSDIHTHDGKWEIKVAPYNASQVWVSHPDGWIHAPRRLWRDPFAPHFDDPTVDMDERAKIATEQSRRQGVDLHQVAEDTFSYTPPVPDTADTAIPTAFNPEED
ncbi:Mu transposase C-terminal domain-containing protein [Frigoribacterium sp. UYMn621]|uniref:Mu transposase C-terminal domain-containing protein n=1 Tax=Frigoribacterium sp. UYMn621 TaxID=3156343 RepID=UPI003396F07A